MLNLTQVLLFEYFNSSPAAYYEPSLRQEGYDMFVALARDLQGVKAFQVTVLLDARIKRQAFSDLGVKIITATPNHLHQLSVLLEYFDVFLPIAPETDGLLFATTQVYEQSKGRCVLISSNTAAIKVASSKLQTSKALAAKNICTPATVYLKDLKKSKVPIPFPCVIKPDDGFASQAVQVVQDSSGFVGFDPRHTVVQPYVEGQHASMSVVYFHETTQLLSANIQHIEHQDNGRLVYRSCDAGQLDSSHLNLLDLAEQIREAIPGLYGYVGIDFIVEPEGNIQLIEINPRLTSAYTGLSEAGKENLGDLFLSLYHDQAQQDS